MQRNAASCRDHSTSCEVGLSKSIQAELPTPSVSRGTQTNKLRGLQEFSSTPSVSLQNRVHRLGQAMQRNRNVPLIRLRRLVSTPAAMSKTFMNPPK
ncbi:hypothetical protein MRX96_051156 [Rhipicephalus microplus]